MHTLSPELFWLILTALMTLVIWVPYVLDRIMENGIWKAAKLTTIKLESKKIWGQRVIRAHLNSVENLVAFAPIVLVIEISQNNTAFTAMACMVYFASRVAHYFLYVFGVPYLRTAAFMVGWAMQIALALTLLGVM